MNATIEYLELLRDALIKRRGDADDNEDYAKKATLDNAACDAQQLINTLSGLERRK